VIPNGKDSNRSDVKHSYALPHLNGGCAIRVTMLSLEATTAQVEAVLSAPLRKSMAHESEEGPEGPNVYRYSPKTAALIPAVTPGGP
jgi:hypothetical protein